MLSRFKLTICENASFHFVQSDKIQVALNHVAAKRSVCFGRRALTGPDRFWFKTSSRWVSAATREVNSAKSDDEHYRNGQLCLKAQVHTATRFAAFLSSGITLSRGSGGAQKGMCMLSRECGVYPVINSVPV